VSVFAGYHDVCEAELWGGPVNRVFLQDVMVSVVQKCGGGPVDMVDSRVQLLLLVFTGFYGLSFSVLRPEC